MIDLSCLSDLMRAHYHSFAYTLREAAVLQVPTWSFDCDLAVEVPAMLRHAFPDERVLVLTTTRHHAWRAAQTYNRLGGRAVALFGRDAAGDARAEVSYTTYGAALQRNLLDQHTTVVLDNTHEHEFDITLAKALLQKRLRSGRLVTVVLIGSDGNQAELGYWGRDRAALLPLQADPPRLSIIESYVNDTSSRGKPSEFINHIAELALGEQGQNLLVHLESHTVVQDAEKHLRDILGPEVEIATLTSETPFDRLPAAIAPPKPGHRKLLLGTSVLEAGFDFDWIDAAVSNGQGRRQTVVHERFTPMKTVALSQNQLIQQAAATPGKPFTLASAVSFDARAEELLPDALVLPPKLLLQHALRRGVRDLDLDFYPATTHGGGAMREQWRWAVGEFRLLGVLPASPTAPALPNLLDTVRDLGVVGPDTAVFLYHARQLGVLPAALYVAVAHAVECLRVDRGRSFGACLWSDLLDEAVGVTRVEADRRYDNTHRGRVYDAVALLGRLARALDTRPNPAVLLEVASHPDPVDHPLVEAIFAAGLGGLVTAGETPRARHTPNVVHALSGNSFLSEDGSCLTHLQREEVAVARSRVIVPRGDKAPFAVMGVATVVPWSVVARYAERHPERLTVVREDGMLRLFSPAVNGPLVSIPAPAADAEPVPLDNLLSSVFPAPDEIVLPDLVKDNVYDSPEEAMPGPLVPPPPRRPPSAPKPQRREPASALAEPAGDLRSLAERWGANVTSRR